MKKMIKIAIILILIFVILIGIFIAAVALSGDGKIQPFYDANGNILENSIAEKTFINVNGRENGIIIRGKNLDNPVLLFISGGPGVPEYWLNVAYEQQHPNKIEDEYTVCWWDYAGEGLSYDSGISPEELTIDRLADDAVTVTEYLKKRFGKEKIYLMAHSGGTPLGLYLAQNKPDNYYCYFSMGQVVTDGNRRYEEGYAFMKEQFEDQVNEKGLQLLNKFVKEENGEIVILNPETIDKDWENVLLLAGCGTFREMRSDAFDIFFPQLFSSCYTLTEKIDYWRGKALLSESPYREYAMNSFQVKEQTPAQIPVYFLSGYYDYTTPVTLTRELYENLEAPDKAFYVFDNSAHSPLWEENEKVLEVMRKYVR